MSCFPMKYGSLIGAYRFYAFIFNPVYYFQFCKTNFFTFLRFPLSCFLPVVKGAMFLQHLLPG